MKNGILCRLVTDGYRRRTMKDKMFGRPIVELPQIYSVREDSQPALYHSSLLILLGHTIHLVLHGRENALPHSRRPIPG